LLGIVSLLVLPYTTVLPVFAKQIFKGDALTFGSINSFVGIGSVAGTIYLASRKPTAPLKKILFFCTLILGVGLIGFSQSTNFRLALGFAMLIGFGAIAQFTISNIFVQSEAAPEKRGRVIGILLMAIFGMLPLGSLLIGAVAEHAGAPVTVLAEGIIGLVTALVFGRFLMK
jgi:hypothetical protein